MRMQGIVYTMGSATGRQAYYNTRIQARGVQASLILHVMAKEVDGLGCDAMG